MVALRRGFPIFVCKCGTMKIGKHSVTLDGTNNLIVWDTSATEPAAVGRIGMDFLTGRPRAFTGGESRDFAVAEDVGSDAKAKVFVIQHRNGSTSLVDQYGYDVAPTVEAPGGTSRQVVFGVGEFLLLRTGAVAGQDGGLVSVTFDQTQRSLAPVYDLAMKTGPDITSVRFWMGLFSADPMGSSDPAIHGAGFRYDTGVDGTAFWRAWTSNGVGPGTVTVTDFPVTTDASRRFKVVGNRARTNFTFYIDGVLKATHTTTLPGDGTDLGHVEQVRALAAADRVFGFSRVSVAQRATLG